MGIQVKTTLNDFTDILQMFVFENCIFDVIKLKEKLICKTSTANTNVYVNVLFLIQPVDMSRFI